MLQNDKLRVKDLAKPLGFDSNQVCLIIFVTIVAILMLGGTEVFAMTDDSMKKGLTILENSLTGSWMRMGLIVGGFIGTITSFIKQSPIGLVASAGTGLGACFFTEWVKTAFTAVIG